MTITLWAASAPHDDTADPISVAIPSGTSTGDVTLISSVCAQETTSVAAPLATVPAGWTAVINVPGFILCYRAYQAGDPTSVSITWGSTHWKTTGALTYSGCDTANPIDGSTYFVSADMWGSHPVMRAPSLAPRYASGRLVCTYAMGNPNGGVTITLPSGLTSRSSSVNRNSFTMADKANGATNDPTGDQQATISTNSARLVYACQVLLKANGASSLTQADNFINTAVAYQQAMGVGPSVSVFSLAALGVKPGDLLLLVIASSAATITPPSGWTTLHSSSDGLLCYRLATAGDNDTPTITISSASNINYGLVALRPAYAFPSGNISVDDSGQNTAASSTTVSTPSLTPNSAADFLALFAASKSGAATWTLSAGATRDLINGNAVSTNFGWKQPSDNPSGSFTWTANSSLSTLTAWSVLARLLATPVPVVAPLQMLIA